uniref:Uncharacterized protein n=1 Tax=Arundo donax TaxID=35708 RepID=A0A0A9FQD6_ARUDO
MASSSLPSLLLLPPPTASPPATPWPPARRTTRRSWRPCLSSPMAPSASWRRSGEPIKITTGRSSRTSWARRRSRRPWH